MEFSLHKMHGSKNTFYLLDATSSTEIPFIPLAKWVCNPANHQGADGEVLNQPNPYTPDGVNVSYVYPLSKNELFVRTFERGVGFTNACGTAMTASALVAYRQGLVNTPYVMVYNPGGFVQCTIHQTSKSLDLRLIGNATYVEHVEIKWESHQFSVLSRTPNREAVYYDGVMQQALQHIQNEFN